MLVPLAVRVRNARYDGMLTGFLHDAPKLRFEDPGGFKSGSFVVSQKLGFRSDLIQPYSRVYFYNPRNGDCIAEGDVTHPGKSISGDGALLEVSVDGGVERLNDWSGSRIYVDRDMQAWTKNPATSNPATTVDVGEDRGGSGLDSLTLAFPDEVHVETNYRCEAGYYRIREAGQTIGRFDYTDDGGHTSGDPGWQVRTIITPPSTVARTQTLNVSGHTSSPQNVTGNDWHTAYVQLIWTSGSSNTGTLNNVWVSIRGLVVVARTKLKDGTDKTTGYANAVTAAQVWEDMLGDMLADSFDGPNATVDTGTGAFIYQLAYPDGVTCQQIAEDLLTYEPGMTYVVGPSSPTNDKYSFKFINRSDSVRYEAMLWTDEYSGGIQPVEQYNEVVARWKDPIGNMKMTTATQSIPEMDAVGRTRRYFQDLGQIMGSADNVTTANATVLQEHRHPRNTGRVRINRGVVDLFTGRLVQPYEIQPGYLIRLVGVNPTPDALNTSLTPNGSTICRILTNDSDGLGADLDLDAVPYSMAQAIRYTRHLRQRNTPVRRAF